MCIYDNVGFGIIVATYVYSFIVTFHVHNACIYIYIYIYIYMADVIVHMKSATRKLYTK